MEVFNNMITYASVIRDSANLGSFSIRSWEETVHQEAGKDKWISIINVGWAYTNDWTIYRDAPILKEMGITI